MLVFLGLAYLIAAIPFGLVISTLYGGDADIRATGSGNIGATNVARVYGWQLAIPVLVFDVGKGFFPVVLARMMWPEQGIVWVAIVAAVVFLAHCFSVYLEFRGGKGVATGAGAMLAISPFPTLGAAALWVTLLLVTGRSSIASLGAAATLVITMYLWDPVVLPAAVLLGAGIAYTHTANIRRLWRGEESQIVRPVRWGRAAAAETSALDLLEQGPAGSATTPAVWKEAVRDPLDTDVGEEEAS